MRKVRLDVMMSCVGIVLHWNNTFQMFKFANSSGDILHQGIVGVQLLLVHSKETKLERAAFSAGWSELSWP